MINFAIGFLIALFIPSPLDDIIRKYIRQSYNKVVSWFAQ